MQVGDLRVPPEVEVGRGARPIQSSTSAPITEQLLLVVVVAVDEERPPEALGLDLLLELGGGPGPGPDCGCSIE